MFRSILLPWFFCWCLFASRQNLAINFVSFRHSNDIALIKLKSKSYVSKKKVLAMCKKSYYKDKASSLYVVGMGVTQGNSNYFPKQLQKIRLKETQGNCYFKSIFNPKKQVCTKPTDKYQTQATCQGCSFFLSLSSLFSISVSLWSVYYINLILFSIFKYLIFSKTRKWNL